MTPAPITQAVATSPSQASLPSISTPTPVPAANKNFDDMFHAKFMSIIQEWKNDPQRGQLTQKDRKAFIETAYSETDASYFGGHRLTDADIKLRALTKVFYKVLAEEPWSEDWIRAPDVERKLSKFEMNKETIELANAHGLLTPRDAVKAAREAALKHADALKDLAKDSKKTPNDLKLDRGPYDEIEIIYIAGTVSSTATNRIDREHIYPVSVASVANVLQNHICRDMVRPFTMAERFINCSDTKELEKMRKFACDVCDFAPHLLDNDNVSLLVVLLILSRSDCCRRFENNGIRIEGSTISHRKAECMKNKMGWKTSEEKKPYDNFANEFQARVKNACFPAPRANRISNKKPQRKSSMQLTPVQHPGVYPSPHLGYMASPQGLAPGSPHGINSGINVQPPSMHSIYSQSPVSGSVPGSVAASSSANIPASVPAPALAPSLASASAPLLSRISTGLSSPGEEAMDLS